MSTTVISNFQPVRRDMSYRKPAPVYVPTPPSSPPIKPVSPPQRKSMAIMHDELPPLPNDWRDAIGRATSLRRERQTSAGNKTDTCTTGRSRTPSRGYAPPRVRAFSDPCSMPTVVSDVDSMSDYSDEEMITPPTSPVMYGSSPPSSRKRALPVEYRPPTPPLPAHTKRERRISEFSAGYKTPPSIYHAIFPDPAPTEKNGNRPNILAAPSFQTETTQTSASGPASSLDERDSWATDTWCIIPPAAAHHIADHHSREIEGKFSRSNSSHRPLWSRLTDLLKTRFRGMKSITFDCGSPY